MLWGNVALECQRHVLGVDCVASLTNDSPQTILLSDVVGTGTEGLFTADGETTCVHEVTKEFPAYVVEEEGGNELLPSRNKEPRAVNVSRHPPVGTSNTSKPFAFATRSIAPLVGILLAKPLIPPFSL
jgi:hypothetical protein